VKHGALVQTISVLWCRQSRCFGADNLGALVLWCRQSRCFGADNLGALVQTISVQRPIYYEAVPAA